MQRGPDQKRTRMVVSREKFEHYLTFDIRPWKLVVDYSRKDSGCHAFWFLIRNPPGWSYQGRNVSTLKQTQLISWTFSNPSLWARDTETIHAVEKAKVVSYTRKVQPTFKVLCQRSNTQAPEKWQASLIIWRN